MSVSSSKRSTRRTAKQKQKREIIFEAALDVFSSAGLRGATLDQIADVCGLSKQNIIYYFAGKDEIYSDLLERLLADWLDPLRDLSADGEPIEEILRYVRRKLRMSQEMPRESRLFATEVLHGAPRLGDALSGELRDLVDEKAAIIAHWMTEGRLKPADPHHLIFSIWSMTQHYADFDLQVQAVLGPQKSETRFADAETFLTDLFTRTLCPEEA